MSSIMYRNMKKQDEYYTSKIGVLPVVKHLEKGSTIGCPFDLDSSEYVITLKEKGFNVINTHIGQGQDFLTYEPDFEFDYIISNPPYSIKEQILEKLFSYNKPFAMLLGVQCLTIRKFMKLWQEKNLQLILFENKIFFKNGAEQPTHYKEPGTYFNTYYFCNGGLKKDLYLEVLEKEE